MKGPILLVQGAGVRANIFNPPNPVTLIEVLVKEGYDVWINNWRASIDLPFIAYDLDQAAVFDHPVAVQKIVEKTGSDELKAIIHCQGSTSFMISLINGLVPQVKVVVSNAVSLHPIVPAMSRVKIQGLLPFLKRVVPYLDAQWANEAEGVWPRLINATAQFTQWEKDTRVGKFASFMFGSGYPSMWRLENLSPETQQWMAGEFGKVAITFFEHIAKCIRAGRLVSNGTVPGLPDDYTSFEPMTDARFSFFSGSQNRTFLWQSQQKSCDFFNSFQPGRHSFHRIEGYSHLDLFYGRDAHRDVFPLMVAELSRPN